MPIEIDPSRCTGCSYCMLGCPSQAIRIEIDHDTRPVINEGLCNDCGECEYLCPNNVFSGGLVAAKPADLQERYDATVIGAGIGGLMAAAGLARAGKKVLVLEQLSFIGGKYTQLSYQGYAITTAAWTCPGPKSRIGKLCTKLGAPIQWVTIHDVKSRGEHWVLTHDGRRFASTDEAQAALVGGAKGMARVYQWIADMYDPSVSYPEDMTARQYIERYFPGNQDYMEYVQTIITYCFASQTVDTFSANETKRAIVDALEQMAVWGTAVGGTSAIVKGLEAVIRQHGGEIATHTKVDRILLEGGKAVGVRLKDGRIVRSGVVVHDAGIRRLIQLVGEANLPADYVQRLRRAVPAVVAALILGLKHDYLGKEHSLLHTMGWERTLNTYAPTFFDPHLAPAGKHILDVFWVMEPPYDLKHEVELVKGQLRQIFPDFDQAVELAIPMFFRNGWTAEMAHRLGQSGSQRLDPISPIPALYLVGYDCIGYGMAGDIIPHGVEKALNAILGDPQYKPQDEQGSSWVAKKAKSWLFKVMATVQSIRARN
jgi:phytoene dehydrogenase-like protein/NAD-dependent dihydropyrimidine dehydrogenase PreA subunit